MTELSTIQTINSRKDEVINLSYIAIKNLLGKDDRLEINEKFENRVAILKSNHSDLAQYSRHNNVIFGGITESMSDNNLRAL